MKQIYINTMLGTTRIDYDPNDPRDIIINATICNIDEVVYDYIECTDIGIQPEDIELIQINGSNHNDELFVEAVIGQDRRDAIYKQLDNQ